jgi:hypothetical protein
MLFRAVGIVEAPGKAQERAAPKAAMTLSPDRKSVACLCVAQAWLAVQGQYTPEN